MSKNKDTEIKKTGCEQYRDFIAGVLEKGHKCFDPVSRSSNVLRSSARNQERTAACTSFVAKLDFLKEACKSELEFNKK